MPESAVKRFLKYRKEAITEAAAKKKAEEGKINGTTANKMEVDSDSDEKVERPEITTKRGRKVKNIAPRSDKPISKKPARKKTSQEEAEDNFSWICSICGEAECDACPETRLIICDGGCFRAFHVECVTQTGGAAWKEGEDWSCDDCLKRRHRCGICGEYGEDGVEGGVYPCSRKHCGRYYHINCVQQNSATVMHNDLTARFSCPAHVCWTCQDGIPAEIAGRGTWQSKKGKVYTCLHCPRSFHLDCISPGCRFHELALCCHEHHEEKLPELIDSVLEGVSGEVVLDSASSNALSQEVGNSFPAMYPLPKWNQQSSRLNEHHYRLPVGIRDVVDARPPHYGYIASNKLPPIGEMRPERTEPTGVLCNCIRKAKAATGGERSVGDKRKRDEVVGVKKKKRTGGGGKVQKVRGTKRREAMRREEKREAKRREAKRGRKGLFLA